MTKALININVLIMDYFFLNASMRTAFWAARKYKLLSKLTICFLSVVPKANLYSVLPISQILMHLGNLFGNLLVANIHCFLVYFWYEQTNAMQFWIRKSIAQWPFGKYWNAMHYHNVQVGLLGPSDYFGEIALMLDRCKSFYYQLFSINFFRPRAVKPCTILTFFVSTFSDRELPLWPHKDLSSVSSWTVPGC